MKRMICRLLIFSILLCWVLPVASAAQPVDFADADAIRSRYAVEMLVDLELIVGDQNGNFRPDAFITRAETAKLIACLCTDEPEGAAWASFADTETSWARKYIAYCAANGIVGGSGGYFRPQDNVTAQELAKMLLVTVGFDARCYSGAGWAERVNNDAIENGIYHDFSGNYDAPITRNDACLLIYNALQCPATDGINADGTVRYVLDDLLNQKTYLEVRFGAVRYTALLTGNEHANLSGAGNRLSAGMTKLEGHRDFAVSTELGLVGHMVDVYLRDGEVIGMPAAAITERSICVTDSARLERIAAGNGYAFTPRTQYYEDYVQTTEKALDSLGDGTVVFLIDHDGDGQTDMVFILNCEEVTVTSTAPLMVRGTSAAQTFFATSIPQIDSRVRCFTFGGSSYVLS